MARHPELVFPHDLCQAMELSGVPLAFSTIQRGDTNPYVTGSGGAEGSIGLLVDISRGTIIHKVYWADIGSNETGSLGFLPTEKNCADSIDKRRDSNEWRVENYAPVAIFILPPIFVRQMFDVGGVPTPGPKKLTCNEAIAPFQIKESSVPIGIHFLSLTGRQGVGALLRTMTCSCAAPGSCKGV
jgi:hypothetical protein